MSSLEPITTPRAPAIWVRVSGSVMTSLRVLRFLLVARVLVYSHRLCVCGSDFWRVFCDPGFSLLLSLRLAPPDSVGRGHLVVVGLPQG